MIFLWELFLFFVLFSFLLSKITAEFVRPLDFFCFTFSKMLHLLFWPMKILSDHCEKFAVVRSEKLPQNGNHLIRNLWRKKREEKTNPIRSFNWFKKKEKRTLNSGGSLDWISRKQIETVETWEREQEQLVGLPGWLLLYRSVVVFHAVSTSVNH